MILKETSIPALFLGAVSVSAIHASIPSHWFSFAAVARSQRWTMRQALSVTALAGLGHVLLTALLGVATVLFGKSLLSRIPPQIEHAAASIVLAVLGVYFLWQSFRSVGCHHGHHHDEEETSPHNVSKFGSAPKAMAALTLGMTLSPCLDLLSVYVAGAAFPWGVLLIMSLLMALTTIGLMMLFVFLAMRGMARMKLSWLERYEGQIVGCTLILLSLVLYFV